MSQTVMSAPMGNLKDPTSNLVYNMLQIKNMNSDIISRLSPLTLSNMKILFIQPVSQKNPHISYIFSSIVHLTNINEFYIVNKNIFKAKLHQVDRTKIVRNNF